MKRMVAALVVMSLAGAAVGLLASGQEMGNPPARRDRPVGLPGEAQPGAEPGMMPEEPTIAIWPPVEPPRVNIDYILGNARRLGLSEAQMAELKKLRLDLRLKTIGLQAQRQQNEARLDALLEEDNVNLEEAKKLLRAMAETEAEIRFAELEATQKAKNVLTARQRERLKEMPVVVPWRGGGPRPELMAPPEAPAGEPLVQPWQNP